MNILLLGIPVAMLHLAITQKALHGKINLPALLEGNNLFWFSVIFSVLCTVYYLLFRRSRSGLYLLWLLVLCNVAYGLHVFLKTQNYGVVFWLFLVILISAAYSVMMDSVLKKSFINSKKRWFEGTPRFICNVKGELQMIKKMSRQQIDEPWSAPVSLSNLDDQGCFIYMAPDNKPRSIKGVRQIRLTFTHPHDTNTIKMVTTNVKLASNYNDGYGLKFTDQSCDLKKELIEFYELVRSYGYVD